MTVVLLCGLTERNTVCKTSTETSGVVEHETEALEAHNSNLQVSSLKYGLSGYHIFEMTDR